MYVRPQEVGRSLIFLHGALGTEEETGQTERERAPVSLALGPSIKASFIGKDGAEGRNEVRREVSTEEAREGGRRQPRAN